MRFRLSWMLSADFPHVNRGTTSGSYAPAAYRTLAAYMSHVSCEVLLSAAEHVLLKMELLNSQMVRI